MLENIPEQEIKAFNDFIQVFHQGARIMMENQRDELGLCLLREGEVILYKTVGKERKAIDKIRAINFIEELSVFNNSPRESTVEIASKQALIYAFPISNIAKLFVNPNWGMMLFSRLASYYKATQQRVQNLQVNQEKMQRGLVEVFSLLVSLQRTILVDAAMTKRESQFIMASAIQEVIFRLISTRFPEYAGLLFEAGFDRWEALHKEGIVPPALFYYLKKVAQEEEKLSRKTMMYPDLSLTQDEGADE